MDFSDQVISILTIRATSTREGGVNFFFALPTTARVVYSKMPATKPSFIAKKILA